MRAACIKVFRLLQPRFTSLVSLAGRVHLGNAESVLLLLFLAAAVLALFDLGYHACLINVGRLQLCLRWKAFLRGHNLEIFGCLHF